MAREKPQPDAKADRLGEGDAFVSTEELARLLGVDGSTLRRWEARGLLPAPIRIARTVRWQLSKVITSLNRSSTDGYGATGK